MYCESCLFNTRPHLLGLNSEFSVAVLLSLSLSERPTRVFTGYFTALLICLQRSNSVMLFKHTFNCFYHSKKSWVIFFSILVDFILPRSWVRCNNPVFG